MTSVMSVLGGVLVATALWDVFHTLWNPSGQGPVSRLTMRAVWWMSRHDGAGARRLSGPTAMVLVIASWAALVAVGWALIYWPHVPDEFTYSPGLAPEERSDFLDALYLSVVVVATLGLGDIVPAAPVLRLLVPLEALLGFALLTAAVSWVLQIYPALTRRRALALKLKATRRAATIDVLPQMEPHTAARLMSDLADGVSHVYVDLLQYSETYYFHDANPRSTLARSLPYGLDLADAAQRSESPDVRHAGTMLRAVIEDLAEVLDEQFLSTGLDTAGVLDAYRRDQSTPSS